MPFRGSLALSVSGTILIALALTTSTSAHSELTLSGTGTATIDGVLAEGEWEGAISRNFLVALPPADGGGWTSGTVRMMNDAENLYVAVAVVRSHLAQGQIGYGLDSAWVYFDNQHDGDFFSEGDDYIAVSPGLASGPAPYETFVDGVRTSLSPCPPGGGCGFFDVQVGGTTDGSGVATNNGTVTVYEMSHPLDSSDQFDFSLDEGDAVGFYLHLQTFSLTPFCASECYADTFLRGANEQGGDYVVSGDQDGDGIRDESDRCMFSVPELRLDADGDGCTDTVDRLEELLEEADPDSDLNGLRAKLIQARTAIDQGKLQVGINKLLEFAAQAEALSGSKLLAEDADLLARYSANVAAVLEHIGGVPTPTPTQTATPTMTPAPTGTPTPDTTQRFIQRN